jgi:hypothetical protein
MSGNRPTEFSLCLDSRTNVIYLVAGSCALSLHGSNVFFHAIDTTSNSSRCHRPIVRIREADTSQYHGHSGAQAHPFLYDLSMTCV